MALVSPGIQVTVTDQSLATNGGSTTLPLIIIATAQNKNAPVNSSTNASLIAPGTTVNNIDNLWLVTSQNELINTFGVPIFHSDPANELNEYGLLAAYQFLGIASNCWILRASVPLDQLVPSSFEPTKDVPNGTYWFDTSSTVWGIFRSNGSSNLVTAWNAVEPLVASSLSETETVIVGNVGFASNTTVPGFAGTLIVNGTTVNIAVTDTLIQIRDKINSASIPNIKAMILRYRGRSWLVLRNTASEDIVVGGTLAGSLGFSNTTQITQLPLIKGVVGDTGVVAANTDNLYFEKIRPTNEFGEYDPDATDFWFLIGSEIWKAATPTAVFGVTTTNYLLNPIIANDTLVISDGTNTVNVTFAAADIATLTTVVNKINTAINSAGLSNTFGAKVTTTNRLVISNFKGEDLFLTNGPGNTGNVLTSLQISSSRGNRLFYAPHYQIPANSVSGDIWIKITKPNAGANYVVKFRENDTWLIKDAPFHEDDDKALHKLGTGIAPGTLYVQYNLYGTSTRPIASHMIRKYNGFTEVVALSTEQPGVSTPALVPGDNFVIVAGNTLGNQEVNVITIPSTSLEDLAIAINNAGFSNVVADVAGGYLRVVNTAGFTLTFTYTDPVTLIDYSTTNSDDPLQSLGFTDGQTFSNFEELSYIASESEPRSEAEEKRLWFNDDLKADIMVSDGSKWWGYRNYFPTTDPNGVIIRGSQPLTQSDGTPLVENDLWIDSSDIENYPRIYRYRSATRTWEPIDNTDQTTPLGIVFADARYTNDGTREGSTNSADLVLSDFVDPDAPDPRVYPAGILLFNTRASTFNVKEWRPNHFAEFVDKEVSPGVQYTVGSVSFPTNTITKRNQGRWVTISGSKPDGSPFMGRKAQREVIVTSLQGIINSNQDIRSESVYFNLIACPGYPEVLEELVNLNIDKKEIAFIVGDTPCRLKPDGTSIREWATNANNSFRTGEEGLTISSSNIGLYYPWGLTTNLDGNEVIIPPSGIVLRTIAYNDLVAFPWFAPAGYNRGLVSNVSTVGYITNENEFLPVTLNQGQRDVLYQNRINPIAFIPGRGIVVFGQKTLNAVDSAMSRVNVARLVNFLRYNFEILAKPFLFEFNDKTTRDQVKSAFDRFLSNLVSLRALFDFLVVVDESNNTPERIDRNELWIDVAIQPAKAIEFIYIPIRITNTGENLQNIVSLPST
jgi:hypothetical protein